MLLESDNFLLELTKLFQQQRVKNSGSLSLVMKRYDGQTKPKPKLTKKQRLENKQTPTNAPTTAHDSVEYKCLVRATFGSKKLSTIVSSKDINRFQLAYSNLLKANMDTLKKKAKESKATGQASANANSNVPSSPRMATNAASTSSATNQQKKTPTTPAKKK
ncbi:unnamed protein product [Rotaria magnacalcarata]|uniref:Signal recognition particle 14 kDa protein n=3 Tax=Rotaria magnacalcarata TaxID=392030 RepID=A0A816MT99_9BILA|nr:unnamed protein product [Rotaria magnacalcarata]CAF1998796.1 unnamed protein product [Rotaria magnacalcarata]CAF3830064.1 unnamed protein product [Rotaria magnacalcarata]CAF4424178.1 unnamed protein product [Rotaria magnacalcarata]